MQCTSLFLENGDFDSADGYSERILDLDPTNAQAYIAKLMVELKVRKEEKLFHFELPFGDNSNS